MTRIRIPEGFILGVATSAYQIEGAVDRDGRGPSIWDTFSQTPGNTRGNVPGDRGADHYDRFEEDIAIMKDLGVDSYRLSLSWSRILPNGVGEVNEAGLEFYDRLIDGLIDAGIQPNVTLYHWDLPQALQDRGGWSNRDVADWFEEFARVAFERYGDRVPLWSTLNEPIALWVGYGMPIFAPGLDDPKRGKQAMHNAMLAHGRAVRAFRESGATGEIGIVIDVWKRHVVADTLENHRIALRDEDDSFRFFLDELFAGGLSPRILDRLEAEGTLPVIEDGDARLAGEPIDFLGINVYARVMVDSNTDATDRFEGENHQPGGNYLSNGVELYPDALTEAVRLVRDEYGVTVPIYITENGTALEGEMRDGAEVDDERIEYLAAFLENAVLAHESGLDVRGYYAWSLLDNYEWSAAYTMRFGLLSVHPETGDRAYKKSAHWFKAVLHEREFQSTPVAILDV
ncbi:GH1 family beta-glucosidase [Agromyces subbeticus]|uniref:GH1 family beta-glucosidase n=1 Tax=Agromyces subbeticus TaxID=293890 RepID=UPI0003B5D969|nr:GH1 family beta-glucosidase [Agromyces subbeticus]